MSSPYWNLGTIGTITLTQHLVQFKFLNKSVITIQIGKNIVDPQELFDDLGT